MSQNYTAGLTGERGPSAATTVEGINKSKRVIRQLRSRLFRIAIEWFNADFGDISILKVPGRRSGSWRCTPVKLLAIDDDRYLVALHSSSDWPRNLRASDGIAWLRLGRRQLSVRAMELPAEERPAILRGYLAAATRTETLNILGAGRSDPDDAHLRRIAPGHPVFRLTFLDGQVWPSSAPDGPSTHTHSQPARGVGPRTALC